MNTQIEYRVRPADRYVVTRYETEAPKAGEASKGVSSQHGEYDNFDTAYAVGYALARAEHQRLGYPPGDMRIIYPELTEPLGRLGSAVVSSPNQTFTGMSAGDMLQAVGDDAQKWATAFAEQYPDLDQGVMIGWFANAIENTWDTRCSRFTQDGEAWDAFREQVERHRALWRDLKSGPENGQHSDSFLMEMSYDAAALLRRNARREGNAALIERLDRLKIAVNA